MKQVHHFFPVRLLELSSPLRPYVLLAPCSWHSSCLEARSFDPRKLSSQRVRRTHRSPRQCAPGSAARARDGASARGYAGPRAAHARASAEAHLRSRTRRASRRPPRGVCGAGRYHHDEIATARRRCGRRQPDERGSAQRTAASRGALNAHARSRQPPNLACGARLAAARCPGCRPCARATGGGHRVDSARLFYGFARGSATVQDVAGARTPLRR
ncbi:hypothetical protein PsYK624_079560 [Phanerochaete sordida]|uniref:Uncharacterized protein n=1 Tax=Phanerochaete sordida TaxID=48140 RepID=A0A9P3GBV6_9APHY|nr:hypothetical protein PsYK624_079560 [Phanerochaete sordida]